MAFTNHGNRIIHLNGTSGCGHYGHLAASSDSEVKCATNGCAGRATRACHVIYVNQPVDRAKRYIVYCCPTCNGQKRGEYNDVRLNAEMHELLECDCGYL